MTEDEEFLEDITETEWQEWQKADDAERYKDIQQEQRRPY